jgi:hypothetical protein
MNKVPDDVLFLQGKQEDFIKSFNGLITSEPKRKGKPRLATPEEMKSIWKTIEKLTSKSANKSQ